MNIIYSLSVRTLSGLWYWISQFFPSFAWYP